MDDNYTDEKVKIEKVVELILRAMAGRSCREYARAAGISPAGLNKILNKKNLPTPATIKKLMSKAANPQGGVTLEDVMVAAGYIEATDEQKIEEAVNSKVDLIIEESSKNGKQSDRDIRYRDRVVRNTSYREMGRQYEEYVKEKIVTNLVKKGIRFTYDGEVDRRNGIRRTPFDLQIGIDEKGLGIDRWYFRCIYAPDMFYPYIHRMYDLLGAIVFHPVEPGSKISIVINDRRSFEKLRDRERALLYRGELSVIYISPEDDTILELYLANYNENDTSKELYLV